uniref:OmpA family protein n=1 Tax=Chlorobium chlorochromatii (strain CaD3) TaxID=340177 RepID=Q3ARG1_CHLCH
MALSLYKIAKPVALLLIPATLSVTWGCQTTTPSSNAAQKAKIGAAAGGAIGALIGSRTGSWAKGALIGAVVGGASGAVLGNYMDKQAAAIDQNVEGAQVQRVGESIRVVFDSGLLFTTGSSTISAASRSNIEQLARILNTYGDTNVVIEGHTDSIGNEATNQVLSEKRAESVATLLKVYGVAPNRMSAVGYGETRPVATNETEAGRNLNRRVEVLIYATDALRQQAASGQLRL